MSLVGLDGRPLESAEAKQERVAAYCNLILLLAKELADLEKP